MMTARGLLLPWRTLTSTGITRNILYSSSQPGYAKQYSALVSASLRNRLRSHNPSAYATSFRKNSTIAQPIDKLQQTATVDSGTTASLHATKGRSVPSPPENQQNETPAYEITFTCKPCQKRSTHRISKQGYHKGTILITCPDCKNRHLICDHLKIFRDQSTTIEDILKEKGEHIKHGALGTEGDIEIWDDGTTVERT